MYLRVIFIFSFIVLFKSTTFAQDDFVYENQVWVGYLTNSQISDRVSIWNDAHIVPLSFLILRTGATYHFKFSEKVRGTSTLGFSKLWLYSREDLLPTRNEFRPWGQTTATFDFWKFTFSNRFRYDARFRQDIDNNELLDTYTFNWRLRYFLLVRYPLIENIHKQSQWYAYTFNETLFDVGKNIAEGFRLNQNRFTIGVGYKYQNLSFQLGYLNMIKNPPVDGNKILAHTAMLMIFHNFDFRKKPPY
jgi:hypothetical protein